MNNSTPSSSEAHGAKQYQTMFQENIRGQANQSAERNFLGNHRHNIGGAASGGALQMKRYKGAFVLSTVVGA